MRRAACERERGSARTRATYTPLGRSRLAREGALSRAGRLTKPALHNPPTYFRLCFVRERVRERVCVCWRLRFANKRRNVMTFSAIAYYRLDTRATPRRVRCGREATLAFRDGDSRSCARRLVQPSASPLPPSQCRRPPIEPQSPQRACGPVCVCGRGIARRPALYLSILVQLFVAIRYTLYLPRSQGVSFNVDTLLIHLVSTLKLNNC